MSTTFYSTYTEILSRIIQGTATAFDRELAAKYEADRPKEWCAKCNQRLRTMDAPFRILHDNTTCKSHEPKTKRPAAAATIQDIGAGEA